MVDTLFTMRLAVVTLLGTIASAFAADTFIDDLGTTHQKRENPTLILSAQVAVTLHHLGIPDSMIAATYGLPFNRAYFLQPNGETQYETDASRADVEWLKTITSLTPECYTGDQGPYTETPCSSYGNLVDYSRLEALDPDPDFVIESPRFFNAEVAVNYTKHSGADFLFIDAAFEGADKCRPDMTKQEGGYVKDQCYRRSIIHILERYEELAEFLGFELSAEAKNDKQDLCEAADRVQEAGRYAHENDILTMGGAMFDYGDGNYFIFLTNPLQFHSMRTLEGLGIPIIWPGLCTDAKACYQYGPIPEGFEQLTPRMLFPNCGEEVNKECAANKPLYPISFWFLEGTTYTQGINQTLAAQIPDKAILEGQYHYLDANEGVLSYKAAAAYFNAIADKILAAKSLHPRDMDCVDVGHTDPSHTNFLNGGLAGGEFACYNDEHHDDFDEICFAATDNTSASSFASAVFALALALVVALA